MSSSKPESFKEFLSRRKLSSPQAEVFESELNPDSITKTYPNENPENNNNSSKKNPKNKDSLLKMKNSKSSKETKKAAGSNEIKEKNKNSKKNEELRILKFQAMEKERLLEKRKKAVVMIQKMWRGFVQFCKFQAFKYVFSEIFKFEFFLKRIVSD